MRWWKMPVSTRRKLSPSRWRSLKVSSDSSSWPSAKMPLMILSMWAVSLAGVGSLRVLLEASTESASMRMAASLVCGLGPG